MFIHVPIISFCIELIFKFIDYTPINYYFKEGDDSDNEMFDANIEIKENKEKKPRKKQIKKKSKNIDLDLVETKDGFIIDI